MPFFEYKCRQCSQEFEELIRSEDDLDKLVCPKCDSKDLEKMLSLFGMTTSDGKTMTSAAGGGAACSGCAKSSCAGCH